MFLTLPSSMLQSMGTFFANGSAMFRATVRPNIGQSGDGLSRALPPPTGATGSSSGLPSTSKFCSLRLTTLFTNTGVGAGRAKKSSNHLVMR